MRTFYDWRSLDRKEPNRIPLQGIVLWKTKKKWLLWIRRNHNTKNKWLLWIRGDHNIITHDNLHGYMITPRTIYLYNVYIASSLWDAIKHFKRYKV